MSSIPRFTALLAVAALGAASLLAGASAAQAASGAPDWQFGAKVYGWFPSLNGDLRYGPRGRDTSFDVDAADILSDLQFTFMFTLEARKGPWLGFTDVIYLDLDGDRSRSVSLAEGPSINLFDANVNLSGWIWTLAGGYKVWSNQGSHADLFAGLRLFALDSEAKLTGVAVRDRRASVSDDVWDGIVGVNGRLALADRWFLPYYADVGTGDSELTWQAVAGVGYAFDWGDVTLLYRYLSYDQGDDKHLQGLSMGGPMLGVSFRF